MLECLLCLTLSPYFSVYDSTVKSDYGIEIAMGDPLYAFVSYESPDLQILGQNMGGLTLPGFGIGYRTHVVKKLSVFLEFGMYYTPSIQPATNIEAEVVNQLLVNDFGQPGWNPDYYSYKLQSDFGGKVGLSLDLSDRLSVFGAYRYLKVRENFDMCEIGPCEYGESGKHWQERNVLDLSSAQIGISFKFRHKPR